MVSTWTPSELGAGEVILTPKWSWRLVVVSYALSWMGGWTTSAIISHANSLLLTNGPHSRWYWLLWILLASITYGFTSIWSLHLIAMTAETFPGILVSFHPALTALSAVVATTFTFFALIYSARSPFRRKITPAFKLPFDHRPQWGSSRRGPEQESLLELDQTCDSPDLMDTELPSTYSPADCVTSRPRSRTSTRARTTIRHRYQPDLESDSMDEDFESDNEPDPHLLSRTRHTPLTLIGLLRELKAGANPSTAFIAVIWGSAIAFMHHLGMMAMKIPSGRLVWDPLYIVLSCSLALIVSWLGCITIDRIDRHLGRQLLFATLTSLGAFSFHYVSALGVTFITHAKELKPDVLEPSTNDEISFFITGLSVCLCSLCIGLLGHTAEVSRSRLVELVYTKRRLWKVRAQKRAAEGAADLKQTFISVASHELRTPLFSVTGYADLLARTDLNEEQKLYLTNMQQACTNMQLIIANVLDFSKLERNNAESLAKPVCTNLRAMVESICRMTEDRPRSSSGCSPSSVDLIVHVSNRVPETALVDETFLLRICMNLLSNALKFTKTGFILISLDMSGTGNGESEGLVIKVQDTGIGIPKSFRKELFEPYRQADSSTTRPHQGTGLGLSICKQLVQRLDGKIEVDSIEGSGTTFTITLPLDRPSSPPTSPSPKRIGISYHDLRTEVVLSSLLRLDGHQVTELNSPQSLGSNEKDLDMVWTDNLDSFERTVKANCGKIVVTCAEVGKVGKDGRSGVVVLRRHGVIPHLIFSLLDTPEKHLHEIVSDSGEGGGERSVERRESVGTIVTVNSNEDPNGHTTPSNCGSPKMALGEQAKGLGIQDSPKTLAVPKPEEELVAQELEQKLVEQEEKKKVLLVDDNLLNVQLGTKILEKLGYRVEVAYDGIEAVKKACGGDCQLVLMDCQMPGLDGPEATRMIRDFERKQQGTKTRLPIVALTANVSQEDKLICERSGMDDFLPKPLKFNILKATLHRFLEQEKTPKTNRGT